MSKIGSEHSNSVVLATLAKVLHERGIELRNKAMDSDPNAVLLEFQAEYKAVKERLPGGELGETFGALVIIMLNYLEPRKLYGDG